MCSSDQSKPKITTDLDSDDFNELCGHKYFTHNPKDKINENGTSNCDLSDYISKLIGCGCYNDGSNYLTPKYENIRINNEMYKINDNRIIDIGRNLHNMKDCKNFILSKSKSKSNRCIEYISYKYKETSTDAILVDSKYLFHINTGLKKINTMIDFKREKDKIIYVKISLFGIYLLCFNYVSRYPTYNLFTNNCMNFAQFVWREIKDFSDDTSQSDSTLNDNLDSIFDINLNCYIDNSNIYINYNCIYEKLCHDNKKHWAEIIKNIKDLPNITRSLIEKNKIDINNRIVHFKYSHKSLKTSIYTWLTHKLWLSDTDVYEHIDIQDVYVTSKYIISDKNIEKLGTNKIIIDSKVYTESDGYDVIKVSNFKTDTPEKLLIYLLISSIERKHE
jgi:hypothetical protein